MNRPRAFLIASIGLGLFAMGSARAAQLTQVPRSTWVGSVALPSYVQMHIYVPDKLASKPPIVVSSHSCGNSAAGQWGNIPKTKAAADKNGFILILPDNPGQNCWDVGSKAGLTHDGGGDTHAVAQMVRYALDKYGGDPRRVYAFGGSSGAMMTQALLGVYPEMFVAGAARAGVPCGCWAESYAASNQWSGPCAGGSVSKTAAQWGDLVRAINPSYSGHRPRVQLFHGESDETISYKNMGEAIKEWTDVLGLATTPTSTDTISSSGYSYGRQFWKNACGFTTLEAWSAPGQKHSMTYEEDAILKFFGLDTAGEQDPELAACGGAGGNDGGVKDAGAARDLAGGADTSTGGASGGAAGTGTGGTGSGGGAGTGGSPSSAVSSGTLPGSAGRSGGGSSGSAGAPPQGGASSKPSSASSGPAAGTVAGGSSAGSGGERASGGAGQSGHSGASSTPVDSGSSSGCHCALSKQPGATAPIGSALLLALIVPLLRRRARPRTDAMRPRQGTGSARS